MRLNKQSNKDTRYLIPLSYILVAAFALYKFGPAIINKGNILGLIGFVLVLGSSIITYKRQWIDLDGTPYVSWKYGDKTTLKALATTILGIILIAISFGRY